MWQMTTLYPATFFSSVTFKSSDHFPHTSTKAFSRRTPLINKAHYSTLSRILPMLKCTAFQNKVNTMLGDPVLMINRNPVNIPICPQWYLTFLVCVCQLLSCVRLFATPWTIAHQAPLFMEFSRQGYRSGLPCPSPGVLPHPGIEPGSPGIAGRFFTIWVTKQDKLFGNHLQKDNVLSPMNTRVSYPVTFELSFELIYLILAKRSFYLEVKKIVLLQSINQPTIKMQEVVLCVRLCPKC